MKHEEMVRDGIYYAAALIVAGLGLTYVASWFVALPMFLLAAFCLYFFRDPNRTVPDGAVAVSPADGRVVSLKATDAGGTRVSIFLNIFDVHVNRTPIAGRITDVEYQPGRFLVASREGASAENEQNVITVEGDGTRVVFKQIAGLIARRIVCWKKTGDVVRAGERIGLIKFGSRVDVFFGPEWDVTVNVRERVSGGSSVIARRKREQ
ncbi:MAG: phosphatidylserine decarboxylase [Bryobacteraceae bacterium]|jgi:phosphatidylserine decarboxylase